MEDFDTQMEKEKARLNRFISVKEQNNKSEVERMEKVRKDIIKQEQRFNKNIKERNYKQKANKAKYEQTNFKRREILIKKDRDIEEHATEVYREHYKKDLREIKER